MKDSTAYFRILYQSCLGGPVNYVRDSRHRAKKENCVSGGIT